jgi:hypothetical protein
MLLSRGLNGAVGSAAVAGAQIYVADHTTLTERTKTMALVVSGVGLGQVLGPAVVPVFQFLRLGMGMTFVALGLANLLLIGPVLVLIEGDRPRAAARRVESCLSWRDPRVAPFLIWAFLLLSLQSINTATFGFSVVDRVAGDVQRAQQMVSVGLLAGAVTSLFAQWVFIPVLRWRPGSLLLVAAPCAACGNLIMWWTSSVLGAVVGYSIALLGFGFGRPGFVSGASLAVGPEDQAAIAGLSNAVLGASSIAAPIIGMRAYELSKGAPFLANGVVGSLLLVAVVSCRALRDSGLEAEELATDETNAP